MISCTDKAGEVSFQVQVVTRASRSEIAGEHNGALRVRIRAAPVEGAANRELVGLLAKALNVPRSAVEIRSGKSGKLKRITVKNCSSERLHSLVNDTHDTR